MTDVIALAKERRARLAAEISKLDDFMRMAELLVKYSSSKAGESVSDDEDTGDGPKPAMLRPLPGS
ncbi:MAG: hypothetical protein IID49_02230 [Proteobacteria bacterium]|nr:hypothetical protein [Pseudomonadota bacterium]MCH8950930.1 hypothetical protein [Pseudomonadota bacterium]